MITGIINRDYIGYIINNNGQLEYAEEGDEYEKEFCYTKKQRISKTFERRTAVSDLLSGYIEKICQYIERKER